MVMEESAVLTHHSEARSPSGGDAPNANTSTNVYLVGLEFVRQYYTVLNQGPLYLHRFYSDDSSFVHGASARDSKVAYGQQEIHKRIQSLNFHNCHAKIRQVDSHSTLGEGVVIQVTGELSNNGQPMRRFMQTFVLAPQSPKRFYVRNDIFHYQDEVFCDEEGEEGVILEQENDDGLDDHLQHIEPIAVSMELNGSGSGSGEMSIMREMTAPAPVEVEVSVSASPPAVVMDTAPPKREDEPVQVADHVVTVSADGGHQEEDISPIPAPVQNVPKTYANLFKTPSAVASAAAGTTTTRPGTGKPNGPPPAKFGPGAGAGGKGQGYGGGRGSPSFPEVPAPASSTAQAPAGAGAGGNTNTNRGLPPRGMSRGNQNQPPGGFANNTNSNRGGPGDNRDRRERLTSRSSTTLNDETGSVDGDRRRPVHTYPDANQLFVGNLPHFVTVPDMKDIFSQFGEVAEVKIQKPTPKSGGMKVPFFCFVVFEEASSAQAAIEKKSEIFMKVQGGTQRRLNVEPKRSQRMDRRMDGDRDGDREERGGYNRMDTSSPGGGGGGRPRDNRDRDDSSRGSRTFRGNNRGGGGGMDRGGDRGGDRDRRGGGGSISSSRGMGRGRP